MNRTPIRRALVPGVAILAIALSACGAGNDTTSDSGDTSSDGGSSSLSGEISGGGASSQEKAQGAWRAGFQTANPDVTVNYDPIGSGDGRKNFISKAYSFAGTDSALTDDEGELTAAGERCGSDVIQVPAYVSPIAIMFNLEGVDSLDLSAETVSKIFAGTITKWNDPAIAATNDGVDLPDADISPVHRQDDSGTTENFTKYLEAAGNGAWTYEPDGLWPDALTGESAEGTSGVVGAVTNGANTIGYADASAVADTDLGVVSVAVGEEFNAPSAEGAAQVVANSPAAEGVGPTDMAVDLARDTTESGSYPVILVSYLIACSTYPDATEADLVKGFLTYALSTEGQQAAADEAGSAPLDTTLEDKALGLIDAISAG